MELDASDIISRLSQELVQAVQAKVIAESQLAAVTEKLKEHETNSNDED